jgi:SAM-dependent methyltransferase
MEAGCGSGRHSLELVRSGFRDISLMDISPRAIDCARSLFDHFGLSARFAVGDVLAGAPAGRQFDLVFNSGVVEHYSFDAQVAFLRGMASFSRKYVLVLVPNRYCHWYWIYRLQTAATGQWPFGFEKPATSYAGLIEAAGLHCLGRAYFAADAALWAISAVAGMTGQLQEMVRQLHVRGVIPLEQRCYLVGYLAAVEPQSEVPLPFYREGSGPDTGDQADHRAAQAADELAGGVAQTKA